MPSYKMVSSHVMQCDNDMGNANEFNKQEWYYIINMYNMHNG